MRLRERSRCAIDHALAKSDIWSTVARILNVVRPQDHLGVSPVREDLKKLIIVCAIRWTEVLGLQAEDLDKGIFDAADLRDAIKRGSLVYRFENRPS